MDIERAIKNCEASLRQIKQYNPDPYYVRHFFNEYINSVNDTFDGIFEEGDRDFGLFISERISQENFDKKAKIKNDQSAIEFSEWYSIRHNQKHKSPYPNFIKEICQFRDRFERLPEIKIMIRAAERYKDDICQQIKVGLSHEKLRSREELEIEVKRQLPIFFKVINHKRDKNNEPKIGEGQIIASAFVNMGDTDIEIAHAAEIYIPVMRRLVGESRKKIKELTAWK